MAFQGYSGSCSAVLGLQRGSPSTCALNIKERDFRDPKAGYLSTHMCFKHEVCVQEIQMVRGPVSRISEPSKI